MLSFKVQRFHWLNEKVFILHVHVYCNFSLLYSLFLYLHLYIRVQWLCYRLLSAVGTTAGHSSPLKTQKQASICPLLASRLVSLTCFNASYRHSVTMGKIHVMTFCITSNNNYLFSYIQMI